MSPAAEVESGPHIAFLVHSRVDLPGLLEARARARGLPFSVHRLHLGPAELPAPGSFDALVVLGSARSVNDESVPWLEDERRLLRRAADDAVPIFGVCFGGQLLGQVLGGTVRAGVRPEIGWETLESSRPDLIEPGPWLTWHGEVFEPPPGASLVAWTELAPHAFVAGPHLGVQFHPEITSELLAVWVERAEGRGALSAEQAAALLAAAERHAEQAAARADRLFDSFLRRAGLAGDDGAPVGG